VKRLRAYIAAHGVEPDVVLCSSARRTIETFEGIRPALPKAVELRVDEALYAAPADRLLRALRGVDASAHAVMLIGHNPGLEDLASQLVAGGDTWARERMGDGLPTGALASLWFDGPWQELGPGSARLDAFVVPRELT